MTNGNSRPPNTPSPGGWQVRGSDGIVQLTLLVAGMPKMQLGFAVDEARALSRMLADGAQKAESSIVIASPGVVGDLKS